MSITEKLQYIPVDGVFSSDWTAVFSFFLASAGAGEDSAGSHVL
jgi:hypothetical protein